MQKAIQRAIIFCVAMLVLYMSAGVGQQLDCFGGGGTTTMQRIVVETEFYVTQYFLAAVLC